MEELRATVLVKLLQVLPARARPKWAWRVRDKGSAQWVLSLPGAGRTLSRAELQEVVARHLCVHSPACVGRVGLQVGTRGAVVDPFGDAVGAAQGLVGDTWRIRHDTVKLELCRLLQWAGVGYRCEVFGEFAHLVPPGVLACRGQEETGPCP